MLYYPQLSTGSVAQFPVTRSVNMRTVANQLPSGFTIRMADYRRAEGAVAAGIF